LNSTRRAKKNREIKHKSPSTGWPKGFYEKSRGDKTAIELFVAGVRGWGSWPWRQLENSQST